MTYNKFIPVELYRKILSKKMKPNHQAILFVLVTYGKDGKDIYPSVARIAHDANYSEKQIPNILKELEQLKVLNRTSKKKFRTIVYNIDLDVLPDKEQYISKKVRDKMSQEEINESEKPDDPSEEWQCDRLRELNKMTGIDEARV